MSTWIEVKARYEKTFNGGTIRKVTEPYLVDALSCTEAEARVVEEISPFYSDGISVVANSKTRISEVFLDHEGDRIYRVKVSFITLNEKTGTDRRTQSAIIVRAYNFRDAYDNFMDGMRGTMADFEIESISETKYVDIFPCDGKEK